MKESPQDHSREELLKENMILREEVRVARRASELTAQLVAEQFAKTEEILLRLEQKAKAEQELGHKLAEKLQEAEEREEQLASDGQRLEQMQIVAVNMMEDIAAARVTAEMATLAKSEFLANMSHEIRTPMTAILGFADIISESLNCCTTCPAHANCETRSANSQHMQTIRRNGEYLLSLINDILDLSKIEAGKLVVERIACSSCQVVAEVESLIRVRSSAKGLELRIEYAGPIPETIQCDPTRLRQILINLLGNAIKFTETGTVRLIMRLAEDDTGESMLEFDVVDTGLGMTEDQTARIFRPFSQADTSTTRKFGGSGLGLMISKRLAEALGGDVTLVETAPGVGSRFRLTVSTGPLTGVKMLENPTDATTMQPEERSESRKDEGRLNCRILLAEDGPDNRRLLTMILEKAGAHVTIVENGRQAVDAAQAAANQAEAFDVVLMDMQMPIMDGYAATRALRESGYTRPIIALTAHAMAGDRTKCVEAGCDDYASKPIHKDAFLAVIGKHAKRVQGARPPVEMIR